MIVNADNAAPADAARERPLGRSIVRGLRRRCPCCGEGRVFHGLLTVRDRCESCGETLSGHRADDLPAYLTMLLVGHIVIPAALLLDQLATPPLWIAFPAISGVALALVLLLLSPIKGAVIGLQWSARMHGFDAENADPA